MRNYVLSALTALVIISPSAFTPTTVLASAQTQVQSPAQSLSLNIETINPLAGTTLAASDFNTEVAVPAKAQYLAARLSQVQATLVAVGLKPDFAAEYLASADRTGTPWQLIAAVHSVETHQSSTTAIASSAGAQGPMQFMPGTFRAYAIDGNNDGTKDIHNVSDAIATGANYLRAGGAARGDYHSALFNYNHAEWYVTKVMTIARKLGLK